MSPLVFAAGRRLALAIALVSLNALAHGPGPAQHGGFVSEAGDLAFELVPDGPGVALYVTDHGKVIDVSQFRGKLTVLNGKEKSEAPLKPSTGNKLLASPIQMGAGAKAVATVTTANGKTVTVRFAGR
jgi:hypothetical protein